MILDNAPSTQPGEWLDVEYLRPVGQETLGSDDSDPEFSAHERFTRPATFWETFTPGIPIPQQKISAKEEDAPHTQDDITFPGGSSVLTRLNAAMDSFGNGMALRSLAAAAHGHVYQDHEAVFVMSGGVFILAMTMQAMPRVDENRAMTIGAQLRAAPYGDSTIQVHRALLRPARPIGLQGWTAGAARSFRRGVGLPRPQTPPTSDEDPSGGDADGVQGPMSPQQVAIDVGGNRDAALGPPHQTASTHDEMPAMQDAPPAAAPHDHPGDGSPDFRP